MLETSNLARKYTPTCSFRNIPFSAQAPLILLMSAFFAKNQRFLFKKSTFTQRNSMRAVLEIFSSVFSYCKKKVTISENITFADSVSGIRPQDCSKLAKNPKNDNNVTFFRHDVIVEFFCCCFVSLVKFSYWSKFLL